VGDVDAVLDGDLDQFMEAMLLLTAHDPMAAIRDGTPSAATPARTQRDPPMADENELNIHDRQRKAEELRAANLDPPPAVGGPTTI